jgi:hypothetical protein
MTIEKGIRENKLNVLELGKTIQMQPERDTMEAPIFFYKVNLNF